METFAVWRGNKTYVVTAETMVRAIQAAMQSHEGFTRSDSWNAAPMSIYSDKVQTKIIADAVSI